MKFIFPLFLVVTSLLILSCPMVFGQRSDNATLGDMGLGFPVGGGGEEANLDICPIGAQVVRSFLSAWRHEDYKTMYALLDDDSKKDYSFKEATLDFRFLEYKPYEISTVKKVGENFEFIISTGSWREGTKDLKKMIISGKTNKIIMPTRNSPFKRSIEEYL